MSQPQQSQKPKKYKPTPEELAKVARLKGEVEAKYVSPEWRMLAEFGYYYGWEAVMSVMTNEIDIDTFNNLLAGARKVWAGQIVDMGQMTFTAHAAAQSKNPQRVMNDGLKQFYNESKA